MSYTTVTKKKIMSFLKKNNVFGELSEREFLSFIYDVEQIESNDHRYKEFSGDYYQHRINNFDWEDDWRITDNRTGVLYISDEKINDLLCFIISPECQLDQDVLNKYKLEIEKTIRADGYCFYISEIVSGYSVYKIHKINEDPFFIPQYGFSLDSDTGYYEKIVYAKDLFWRLGASVHEKKSAIKELADILEKMRDQKSFEKLSLSKDGDDLFNIANNYQIRHDNKHQRGLYDNEIFYDFIFILYLNQIRLIERLVSQSNL